MSGNSGNKNVDLLAVINHGNLYTRRAFTSYLKIHKDRIPLLVEITNKGRSTCDQYCYETGEFGSGIPSPLHIHLECIRKLYEIECAEGGTGISFAQEMAEAPLAFLKQLKQLRQKTLAVWASGIGSDKLDLLINEAAFTNLKLKGRPLDALTPGELEELHKLAMNVRTLGEEFEQLIAEQRGVAEASFTGSPFPVERVSRIG